MKKFIFAHSHTKIKFRFPENTMLVKDRNFRIFIAESQIQNRISEIAKEICRDYADKNPLFIVILNGAFIFAADLIRHIDIDSEITFVKYSSYEGMESTGVVDELIGLDADIRERHIIIVEDIVDSGITMREMLDDLKKYSPASLEVVTLLQKDKSIAIGQKFRYTAFQIGDEFVIGYGLDYDQKGRNLKDIYVVENE